MFVKKNSTSIASCCDSSSCRCYYGNSGISSSNDGSSRKSRSYSRSSSTVGVLVLGTVVSLQKHLFISIKKILPVPDCNSGATMHFCLFIAGNPRKLQDIHFVQYQDYSPRSVPWGILYQQLLDLRPIMALQRDWIFIFVDNFNGYKNGKDTPRAVISFLRMSPCNKFCFRRFG